MSGPCRFELRMGEDRYPRLLAQTPDPPKVLYGIGDPDALRPGVAVVGARKATPYGLSAARMLVTWAAESGYPVVSGGAYGCDQAAHRAALDAGGLTVAVLGGGADVAYPRTAARLLGRIVRNGAVVSEQPWGTTPKPWMFAKRNRIIAGLSEAVLVLEASLPSGTFSTAEHALDAGREVAAIPGSIYAPECRGANRLIEQGARVICDVTGFAALLESALGPPPKTAEGWRGPGDAVDDCLLSALRTNPMRPDDAARELGLDIVTVSRRVGALEARGLIARYRDGRYGPCL